MRPTRAPRRAGPARGGGRHRRLRRFRLLLQRCCRRLGHARRTRRPLRWRGRPWRWARWCRGHPRERRNGRRRLRGEPRGCGRGGCSCSVRCRRPLRARSTAAPSATERRARRMNQRWRGYRRCGCIGSCRCRRQRVRVRRRLFRLRLRARAPGKRRRVRIRVSLRQHLALERRDAPPQRRRLPRMGRGGWTRKTVCHESAWCQAVTGRRASSPRLFSLCWAVSSCARVSSRAPCVEPGGWREGA